MSLSHKAVPSTSISTDIDSSKQTDKEQDTSKRMSQDTNAVLLPENVPGRYKGRTHDLESFIYTIRKEYPKLTRTQCLLFLGQEVRLGYCAEKPVGVFTWNK